MISYFFGAAVWLLRSRQHGLDPRHVAAEQSHPARLFELAALLLEAEVQAFLAQVALFRLQLIRAHFLDFFEFHFSLGVRPRRGGG